VPLVSPGLGFLIRQG